MSQITGNSTSDQTAESSKEAAKTTARGGKNLLKNSGKKGAKGAGAKGARKGAKKGAKKVAKNPVALKLLKWLAIAFGLLTILMIIIMIVNTASLIFQDIVNTDNKKEVVKDEDLEIGQENALEKDVEYAEIISKYLLEDYDYVDTAIQNQCKREGVDYDLSSENIIDNTVIPQAAMDTEGASDTAEKIAQITESLAWPEGQKSKAKAGKGSPYGEYKDMAKRYKMTDKPYDNCVYFVQLVMRVALDDASVPGFMGSTNRKEYVKKAEKYGFDVIDWNGDIDEFQRGDILTTQGDINHIMIYVGKNSKGKPLVAEASNIRHLYGHVAELSKRKQKVKNYSCYYIVRAKGSDTSSTDSDEDSKDSKSKDTASGSEEFKTYKKVTAIKEITKKTGSIKKLQSGNTAQSVAFDGEFYYVQRINGGARGGGGIVEKYDANGKFKQKSATIPGLRHGNGFTYYPEDDVLYSVTCIGVGNNKKAKLINKTLHPKNFMKSLPCEASGIAYDASTSRWIFSSGSNIKIYNQDMKAQTGAKHITKKGKAQAAQDIAAYNGIIYVCTYRNFGNGGAGNNWVDMYDEDSGKYYGGYKIDYDEIEGIAFDEKGSMVLLMNSDTDYLQFTGISALGGAEEERINVDISALAATREVATINAAFSIYEAQNMPVLEIEEDANKFELALAWFKYKIQRDDHPKRTLKKLLKGALRRYHMREFTTCMFDITYAEPETNKDGKKYYPLIEINPVSSETIAKAFKMDPEGPYNTEPSEEKIKGRNEGKAYVVGDTTIATAIETNTDSHLELLYDSLDGKIVENTRLVLPIKSLFVKIKPSKVFSVDKKGIEVTLKKETDVFACERGRVSEVKKKDDGTYLVKIEGNYEIIYSGLKSVDVKKGEMVSKNKKFATVDKLFRLEIWKDKKAQDPEALLINQSPIGAGTVKGRRRSDPGLRGKYYTPQSSANPFEVNPGKGRGNCTWYAWGRFMEYHGTTNIPLLNGNAVDFYNTTQYKKGKTPRVGALVVWGYNGSPTGSPGHVAFVEAVRPNGDIETSESGWSADIRWWEGYYKKSNNYKLNHNNGVLRGFIYPKVNRTLSDTTSTSSGSSKIKTDKGKAGTYQQYAYSLFSNYGWGASEFEPLKKLWNKESSWNPKAKNSSSGAYGIPQSLPGSKMASEGSDWKTNYKTQIKWGLKYIKNRYGSPSKAWKHSQDYGWY